MSVLAQAAVAGYRSWHDYHAPVDEVPEGMVIVFGAIVAVAAVPVGLFALVGAVLTWRGRTSGLVITAVIAGLGLGAVVQQLLTTIALETQVRMSTTPAAEGVSPFWAVLQSLVAGVALGVAMVVPILTRRRTPRPGADVPPGSPQQPTPPGVTSNRAE